jgi:hypothetical protein
MRCIYDDILLIIFIVKLRKADYIHNSTAHNIEDVIYLFRDPFVKASKVQCKIKSFLEPQ